MRLRLEKCPICSSDCSSSTGEVCDVCHSPFVFTKYLLDVVEREQYKFRLEEYRRKWTLLNHYLKILLDFHQEKWSNNLYWSDIWRQIQGYAAPLNFDEPAIIRRAQIMSGDIKNQSSMMLSHELENILPDTATQKIRQAIVSWVDKLSKGEYSVVEWLNFTVSLDGVLNFDELGVVRDQEINHRFVKIETISVNAEGELYNRRQLTVKRFIEKLDGETEIVMIKIPGGSFEMGDDNWSHTSPRHRVNVPDFYLSALPVTQAQWNIVANLPKVNSEIERNPSYFSGKELPVINVSWLEAVEFCERLSRQTGRRYRLPSESEWEYAACGGNSTAFAFGETITTELANYEPDENLHGSYYNTVNQQHSKKAVTPAGLFPANAYGLYDMHGNVWEWCADVWHKDYSGSPPDNGTVWSTGSTQPGYRVLRGGSWCNWAELCRSNERIAEREDKQGKLYYNGFRPALDL